MSVIHYNSCPVCFSQNIHPVFDIKDHSVSQEIFSVWECADCRLRFTQDVPDAMDIAPYYQSEDYISHSDTSTGLVNRLYHRIRRITLQQKRKLVQAKTEKQKGRLLDIGAGTGAFAHTMQAAGWTVTGLEPDESARAMAVKKYGISLKPSVEIYQLPAAGFDAITLWHVLEHVHDLHGYVTRFADLLAPSGKLLLALPNYLSTDAKKYGAAWAAYDVPRHLYHFSPLSVETLLLRHRLRVESRKAMWFDPFYISMLSEGYANGRPNHLAAFFAGLRSDLAALGSVQKASSIIYIAGKA
ncbi:MAG: class I SAM-dependent methyltransferase [Flavihumibacter sp.]